MRASSLQIYCRSWGLKFPLLFSGVLSPSLASIIYPYIDNIVICAAPARIASFSSRTIAGYGSSLTLECHSVGLPAPVHSWKHGAAPVVPDTDHRLIIFVILNFRINN